MNEYPEPPTMVAQRHFLYKRLVRRARKRFNYTPFIRTRLSKSLSETIARQLSVELIPTQVKTIKISKRFPEKPHWIIYMPKDMVIIDATIDQWKQFYIDAYRTKFIFKPEEYTQILTHIDNNMKKAKS